MEILLNLIENFFIVWFVLVCCKINPFKDIPKLFVVVSASTFGAMIIQQLQIVKMDQSLNMLVCMLLGIGFYTYVLKYFYWKQVHFWKCFGWTFLYFVIFIVAGESVFVPIFFPNHTIASIEPNTMLKFITNVPYRMIQIFIILTLENINGGRIHVKGHKRINC